jgi:hypothetical protein
MSPEWFKENVSSKWDKRKTRPELVKENELYLGIKKKFRDINLDEIFHLETKKK